MRKMTWNVGIAVVIYALVLSALTVGGLLLLRETSAAGQITEYSDDSGVYLLNRDEWEAIMEGKNIQVDTSRIVWRNAFDRYYTAKSFEWIPVAAIVFILFFFVSSILLWRMVIGIQRRETMGILSSVESFPGKEPLPAFMDPGVLRAFDKLRKRFQDHLEDYKRLNSYVSHEQKNSLSVLRARMEMKNDKAALEMIDGIVSNMDDILTLSEDGEPSALEPVDVALICASVCDRYRDRFSDIAFDFEEEQNTMILAKKRWIYRAVNSLVENAVKYGAHGSVHVFVKNRHKSVIVTVQDKGIGIPSKEQDQIFQNRYRVNHLKKDGYGIGLSLVSHVCNLCKGFVYVESEENKGSCFYLSFPQWEEAADSTAIQTKYSEPK